MCEPKSSVCTEAYGPSQHRNTKAFPPECICKCVIITLSRPDIVKQFPGPSLPKLMAEFCFAFRFSYWCMLSPQPYTRTSRALTYCRYAASSLGTHALAIRRSQNDSRSAGLSGYAWIQPARQLQLVVPSQPFIDLLTAQFITDILR